MVPPVGWYEMRAGAEPVVEGGGVVVGGGGGGGFTPPFARAAPEKLKANSNSPNFFVVFIIYDGPHLSADHRADVEEGRHDGHGARCV